MHCLSDSLQMKILVDLCDVQPALGDNISRSQYLEIEGMSLIPITNMGDTSKSRILRFVSLLRRQGA